MPPLEEETTRFLNAWMQVRQMVQAANFNRFQRAGLSATQFMTLNVVPPQGMTLSNLARRLNLSSSTLNQTVNSLEERGFVERTRDPQDARKVIIAATALGEEMQNSASQEFHAFMSSLLLRMSASRRKGLLAGLEQMVLLGQPRQEGGEATAREDREDREGHEGREGREDDAARARRSSRRSPLR